MMENNKDSVATNTDPADDFFSKENVRAGLNDFIDDMKIPKEEIKAPPVFERIEEEEEEGQGADGPDFDDADANAIKFSAEHKQTAEFILIQLDKMLAFSASMISGENSEKYRRRKQKITDDYEAEILAALVKKYQMRLSLEFMLITAIVMNYTPIYSQAISDRNKPKKIKDGEK